MISHGQTAQRECGARIHVANICDSDALDVPLLPNDRGDMPLGGQS